MIVIGVDVHKQSVTAVAVDEAGRLLDEKTVAGRQRRAARLGGGARRGAAVGGRGLPAADALARAAAARLRRGAGAGAAEADGAGAARRQGARQVGPDRRARGRAGGAAGAGPAAAAARRAGATARSKLLVDHRDDLVDERRRTQQRLRWHLHQLDPTFVVPLRMLGRASHLERVSRWLARQEQELQVRLARELVARCRSLTRAIAELDQRARTADRSRPRRRCSSCPAAAPSPPRSCSPRSARSSRFKSDAQLARHSGVAPLEASSGRIQRHRLDRGGNRQLNAALYRIAITQVALPPRRPRLPRTQTSRRQKPTRSDPLPQTTPRPRRLQHTESEPRLDIGATLAQGSESRFSARLRR